MDNNSNKNIFDHIRSKFRADSSTKASWNTPPDFIFEEAMDQVNSSKKNKTRKYYIGLLSFFLLASIYTTHFYFNSKIDSLESKVSLLSTQLNDTELQSSENVINTGGSLNMNSQLNIESTFHDANQLAEVSGKLPSSNASVDRTESTTVQTRKKIADSKTKIQNNRTLSTKTTNSKTSNKNITSNTKKVYNSNNQSKIASSFQSQKNNATQQYNSNIQFPAEKDNQDIHPKNNLDNPTQIESISLKNLYSSLSHPPMKIPFALTSVDDHKKKKPSLIETGYVANASSFCMQGALVDDVTLTGYDQYYAGSGLYIASNFSLSKKLFVRSTFQFSQINNESHLDGLLAYNSSNEFLHNGMTMYDNDMLMETPMGPVKSRESFSVDELNSVDGEAISYSSDIGQRLNVITFKVGPGLYLYDSNKLTLSSSIQLGFNYINNLSGSMSTEMAMKEKLVSSFDSEISKTESMSKSYYSVDIQTGISYKISNKFSLNSGLGFSRSLSTLRSDYATSKLKSWSLNLGISTSF